MGFRIKTNIQWLELSSTNALFPYGGRTARDFHPIPYSRMAVDHAHPFPSFPIRCVQGHMLIVDENVCVFDKSVFVVDELVWFECIMGSDDRQTDLHGWLTELYGF